MEVLVSSASRGLAPHEGLESLLLKLGRTRPSMKPRHGPQAGKSGHPRSQDVDSSPRAQGALELGFEAKPKGKCGAPRAPIACGLGRRVAVDWTWASPLPHAASATARFDKSLRHARKIIITYDRGRRRLAFFRYKWGRGWSPRRPSLPSPFASSSLLLC